MTVQPKQTEQVTDEHLNSLPECVRSSRHLRKLLQELKQAYLEKRMQDFEKIDALTERLKSMETENQWNHSTNNESLTESSS